MTYKVSGLWTLLPYQSHINNTLALVEGNFYLFQNKSSLVELCWIKEVNFIVFSCHVVK